MPKQFDALESCLLKMRYEEETPSEQAMSAVQNSLLPFTNYKFHFNLNCQGNWLRKIKIVANVHFITVFVFRRKDEYFKVGVLFKLQGLLV